MEFNYIVNPETGRRVSIHGKTGQKVLRNYLQAGGAMRSGSRIPPEQYCQNGGAMRSSSRIPPEQYCQNGGAMRSSSRIPPEQYCQKGGNKCKSYRKTKDPKCEEQAGCKWVVRQGCLESEVSAPVRVAPTKIVKASPSPKKVVKASSSKKPCKSYKKTKEPKCEEQPGCHWVTGHGCQDDVEEEHFDDSLTAAQRREGLKAVSDINKMWKTIKKISKEVHGNEFYYMEDPEHWRVPPSVLLESNNVFDLNSLKKQRDLTQEDLESAQAALKAYKAAKKEASKPRAPMRPSSQIENTGKKVKVTTTKTHGKSKRLSAGTYYRSHGNDATLGDMCNIRQSTPPEYKCITKTKSGVARWGKCPSDPKPCKESEYA